MTPFPSYQDLLARVEGFDLPIRRLGYAPDGAPLVAIETGGDKLPALTGVKHLSGLATIVSPVLLMVFVPLR